MAATTRSSLGMALAGKVGGLGVLKPDDGALRDSFTAVETVLRSHKHGGLPTPPNSISPNLPPHPFRNHAIMPHSPRTDPTNVDSDIDLQDAVEHARSQDQPGHPPLSSEALDKLGALDSVGAITPGMLAKHHLPDILLNHGPLAIRHVMGFLTTSVPGFSRIPPAKARRLVVGALEGKGSGVEGAGHSGEVEFEKVGWGRWDASIRGQPARERRAENSALSCGSSYTASGLRIPGQDASATVRAGVAYGRSLSSDFASVSHSDVGEHDADKMSLDGDEKAESRSSSEAPDEPMIDDLEGDATEEEDWAAMGAAALRARSFPSRPAPPGRTLYQPVKYHSYRRISLVPRRPTPKARAVHHDRVTNFHLSNVVDSGDLQEREAVEALLKLGSM